MFAMLSSFLRRLRDERGVLLAFLALAILGFTFLKVASEVMEGETFATDRAIMQAMRDHPGPAWFQAMMLDITAVGGTYVLTLLTFGVTGFLLAARKRATAAFVLAATVGGAMLSVGLKAIFARPRPDLVEHLVHVDTSSFPSGHAMNSAVVFLTLGFLLARTQASGPVRLYLISVAIALTLMVGLSRIYLGVHWPSDVVAGWCVGAAWAGLCGIIELRLQRNRRLEQPDPAPGDP